MSSQRTQRVGELLREEISLAIQRLKDPRIRIVTVTEVQLTPDLREAKVFVSVYGEPDQERQCLQALIGAAGHIRGELGRQLHLRRIPQLHFCPDASLKHEARISELLDSVRTERPPEPGAAPGGQPH